MPKPAPTPQDSAPSPAHAAPDPAILRAERRLALLEEVTEIGMRLLRALEPDASAASAEEDAGAATAEAKTRDPAEAFAPLSRAVRLTIALEARIDAELRDLKAGIVRTGGKAVARAPKPLSAAAAAQERSDRLHKIYDLVLEVAETESEIEGGDAFMRLFDAMAGHLGDDETYGDFHDRPVRETVERLCRDLKLEPDWTRWDGEEWIRDPGLPPYSRIRLLTGKALPKPPD
jgi:hypothetical protein